MVNAGRYFTLIEQLAAGVLVGTLSVATPSIVGAATPSFAAIVLGIISYVAAGVQLIGFVGVSRERPGLFKRYVTLHGIATAIAFSVAAAWIVLSAARHNTAKEKCLTDFFSDEGTGASEGNTLCTIFPWVDVGIMSGLWVLLAALHAYLFFVLTSYGNAQRRDHNQYDQVYDPSQPLTENIPLQNDPWDSRLSGDYTGGRRGGPAEYKHVRQESSVSASDVYGQQYQEPKDAFSTTNFEYSAYPTNPQNPSYPSYAHTPAPVPTPTANSQFLATDSRIETPMQSQPHPAEGSFGRKMPRLS
jgi:hypothetical protein